MTTIRTAQPPKPGPRPAPQRRALPVRSNKLQKGGRSVLYIGANATGKTLRSLSWPGVVLLQFDPEQQRASSLDEEIPVVDIPSWDLCEQLIAPSLKSRQRFQEMIQEQGFPDYEIKTLVVDSYTGLDEMCETTMRARYSKKFDMFDEKRLALREFQQTLGDLTRPRLNELPPWNLIGCVHERVDTVSIKDSDGTFKEVTDGIRASISGQFGKRFFSYWGVVLWCMIDVPTTQTGEIIRGKKPTYYCRTDPIDQWRKGVDRAGKLPSRVAGDYADLMSYWEPSDGE